MLAESHYNQRMFKVDLIVVGKARKGPWLELQEEYARRLRWDLTILEFESRHTDEKDQQKEEQKLILDRIDPDSYLIALDERGKCMRSLDFAHTIESLQLRGTRKLTFVIGGAIGLLDEVREKADLLLGFGTQTWPHMLVRVMLLEQLYRSQQILAGHPYHREG